MMNPPVTLKPQENGNTFKQLVALDGNDYQSDRPFPYKSGQKGKRHHDNPGGNEVQRQGEFRAIQMLIESRVYRVGCSVMAVSKPNNVL